MRRNIIQEVKKIWYGDDTYQKAKITLRDYWVRKAIRLDKNIKVVYKNRYMILTPRKLRNPISERLFKSKIGASDYKLLDFFWNPTDTPTQERSTHPKATEKPQTVEQHFHSLTLF